MVIIRHFIYECLFFVRKETGLFAIINVVIVMKKMKRVIQFFLFVVMLYFFIILGTKDFQTKITDNVRFSNDYKDISKNNVYQYIGEYEVLDLFKGKSGIVFFGFPANIWSHYYADYLNEVALWNGIDTIYYYNFKRDRSMNNKAYTYIVNYLKDYLVTEDIGTIDIKAPSVVILKDGKITYFNNEITFLKGMVTPEEYFTDEKKLQLKSSFDQAIKDYLKEDVS